MKMQKFSPGVYRSPVCLDCQHAFVPWGEKDPGVDVWVQPAPTTRVVWGTQEG